jgi:uncharacterized membrane protein
MRIGRAIMGVLYIGAGVAHFVLLRRYASVVPAYLPAHRTLALISGAAEMAGGLGVMAGPTRRLAAWGLVVLLVAVFPANLWMAQHPALSPGLPIWVLWLRLPLQLPLIGWAWMYTRADERFAAIQ